MSQPEADAPAAGGGGPAFSDFYQFICSTRVIAGRGLVGQAGFEFIKEGAGRVLLVTDEVIRATGLADRVGAGVEDGGLELAGVFDAVPQDSDIDVVKACAEAARDAGADSFLALGGGSVIDTTEAANVIFNPREPTEDDFAELYARAL